MCSRYVSKVDAAFERDWGLARPAPLFESYNVAPTQKVPVVRQLEDGRVCNLLRWGLVPFWTHGIPPKVNAINARLETIATTAAYRLPWRRRRRCILPATGFYEWQVLDNGSKQPYFIALTGQPVFGLAGLWDHSETDKGIGFDSVTIITMPANPMMAEIDNANARMPAILRREDHAAWLTADPVEASACLQSYPQGLMRAYPVSTELDTEQ